VIEKDTIIQEQEHQYVTLKKQFERQPGTDLVEKLTIKETEVREKERQMRAMAGELNMNQNQVSEYKDEVDRLNKELQELKHKFFEQKKKEAAMKERELEWLAESGMMEIERVCRGEYEEEVIPSHLHPHPHRRATPQKPIRYLGGGFRAIPHLDHASEGNNINVFR